MYYGNGPVTREDYLRYSPAPARENFNPTDYSNPINYAANLGVTNGPENPYNNALMQQLQANIVQKQKVDDALANKYAKNLPVFNPAPEPEQNQCYKYGGKLVCNGSPPPRTTPVTPPAAPAAPVPAQTRRVVSGGRGGVRAPAPAPVVAPAPAPAPAPVPFAQTPGRTGVEYYSAMRGDVGAADPLPVNAATYLYRTANGQTLAVDADRLDRLRNPFGNRSTIGANQRANESYQQDQLGQRAEIMRTPEYKAAVQKMVAQNIDPSVAALRALQNGFDKGVDTSAYLEQMDAGQKAFDADRVRYGLTGIKVDTKSGRYGDTNSIIDQGLQYNPTDGTYSTKGPGGVSVLKGVSRSSAAANISPEFNNVINAGKQDLDETMEPVKYQTEWEMNNLKAATNRAAAAMKIGHARATHQTNQLKPVIDYIEGAEKEGRKLLDDANKMDANDPRKATYIRQGQAAINTGTQLRTQYSHLGVPLKPWRTIE